MTDHYTDKNWLVFDFETTNIDYGSAVQADNRILMTAWKPRRGPVRSFKGDILTHKPFWEEVAAADVLVAHNAKFEAHWLLRMGFDPTDKLWYDTMLAERVLAGNRTWPLNLGDVAERWGLPGKDQYIDTLMKCGVCPSEMPQRRLLARCRRDVRTTEQVMRSQFLSLKSANLLPVVYTRCLLTPILTRIEATGMKLDPVRVNQAYQEHAAAIAKAVQELDEVTGGINLRSGPQKAEFLYDTLGFEEFKGRDGKPLRTPAGGRKTDKATMERLARKATTKQQRRFFEILKQFSKLDAALGKNLEFFQGVVKEKGGIFYGEFKQHIAQTHRLTASGKPIKFEMYRKPKSVQFQNMPRLFKRLFTVRNKDYVMVEADGSQIEFRVAAFLGRDTQAISDIRKGADVHRYTAAVINGVQSNQVTKEMRTAAKADTFKPLYGGMSGTKPQVRYYDAFREKYHAIYTEQENWVSEVLANEQLVTAWGLRFYFSYYIDSRGMPRHRGNHKALQPSVFNYPIQSLATAEIIPIALCALYARVKAAGLRVLFVNTVHDSIIAEVHKEDWQAYRQCAIKAFTQDVYTYLHQEYEMVFNVPLGCEIVSGSHWGEGDEESHDVEPIRRVA
jgi:DNA polymerase I-like protein with 3'-5' exonuclease and polymerase domains